MWQDNFDEVAVACCNDSRRTAKKNGGKLQLEQKGLGQEPTLCGLARC